MLCAQIVDQIVLCHVWVGSEEERNSLLEQCDELVEISEPLPSVGAKYIDNTFIEGE